MSSKTKLKKIQSSIHYFVNHRIFDKSYATKNSIKQRLNTSMKDLHSLGFIIQKLDRLKPKHIDALVSHWKTNNLSTGSIKNRMSDFRLLARMNDNPNLMKASNDAYSIPKRSFIPKTNKAITSIDLTKIDNSFVKASVWLQKEFGLRREESIKIIPSQALKINSKGQKILEKRNMDKRW